MLNDSFFEKIIGNLETADKNNIQAVLQRMAKERSFFQMVFNTINEGVLVIGSDFKMQYANPSAQAMIGLPDNYINQPVKPYFRDLEWERMLSADGEWTKSARYEVEILYPVRRLLLFYLVPLAGGSDSATIILHDITESREKTQETIESEKMQMISLLAAGVAHEIGNPLNSLNIHLQLLRRMLDKGITDKKEAEEMLDVASNEVERLDKIINQFLEALRLAKPNLVKLDIKPLIIETLTFLRNEIEDKNIKVKCSWGKTLPPIFGDDNQLKQAFYNLIKNSIQAMPDGGKLDIECQYDDDMVEIAFIDSGKGISPEDLPNVFKPYFSTKEDGNGLGMMVVERIMREHGAELSIDSEPNKKTSVFLKFPRSTKKTRLLPSGDIKEQNRLS